MGNQEQAIISLFNQSYSFQSISGKNTSFANSVSKNNFFFRKGTADPHILSILAGGEIVYTVPVRFSQSPLPWAMLCYVSSGDGTFTIGSRQADLSAGDVFFVPQNTACNFSTARTPFTYDVFYLSGDLLSDYAPFLCSETGYFHRSRTSLDGIVWQLLPLLLTQLPENDTLSRLHISAMLHLVLSTCAQNACPKNNTAFPEHVLRMKEIMDTDYQNPHSLIEFESILGISRYRLCRDFSMHVGISPLQYLNCNRLSAARHLLRSTNLTIREVGMAVGIENTTHFINLFKKDTGITPLQFRQTSTL